MSKEMTEEGQIHKPLLLGGEDCEDDARGGDSSATPMLVFRTLVAVSGSYACGSAVGYLSPAQSGIMQDLDITVAEYSLFGSILTIGAMIGAILSGKLADYIGRRGTMSFSEIFCIIGWLAIAFSKVQVPWWLDLGRLLVGCGMGILSYVVPIYIAEITPKNLRGGFTTVHQLMVCCGVSLTFIVGTLVKWPVLAMIGTVPALVQLLGLFFIPESPRWLAKIGRETECKAALQYLRGSGVDIYEEASEIKIPLTLLGVILTDISGRRPRLMDHQLWRASTPIFALVGVLVYSGSFSLGMGAIPCVIMSEIFPINMKGLGGSLVTLVRWLGSWIVTYSFNFLMEWSSSGVFSIFSSICGFPVLFVVKLIPETKRRTLEDIQSALNTLPAKH